MPDFLETIPLGDNLIFGIMRELFKTSIKPVKNEKGEKIEHLEHHRNLLLGALVVSLFLVVATEPFKVILRKNIGKYAISLKGIIISSILYIICACLLGVILVATNYGKENINHFPFYVQYLCNQYILIAGIIFYFIFAVYVFTRGMDEYDHAEAEAKEEEDRDNKIIDYKKLTHRGDSIIMHHMFERGWTQDKIWRVAEPKACFNVGLILTIVHPLIGLPFLATSLSFWLNEWYHVQYKRTSLREKYIKMNFEMQSASNYYNQNSQNPSSDTPIQET